jgi:outer membrane protein assembly factor BamE
MLLRTLLLSLSFLAACSSTPDVASYLSPYRIDVRQGNHISQEMVARLKPGMTRDQVRFILGTPLIADIFHADRWDYVYLFQPGHGEPQRRRLAIFFDDNKLARVAGDVVAETADNAPVQPENATPATRMIEVPASVKKN